MHPLRLTQDRAILDDILIHRQQDLELAHAILVLERAALHWVALVRDRLDGRSPLRELAGPVCRRRERNDDDLWPALLLDLDEEDDEGDGLDGFCRDPEINAISMQ